ncbi:GNAT family N-acetyltransferase [Fontimonas sp. SYSU GA230001]|uniref:GNAT family N-acetyltransferase n=1 Tax=Fontimonas sp. SYSU GA230001 TaxID=3142450 RepID=UPI0032B51DCC
MAVDIRAATAADVPVLLELIRALAEYEKLLDEVTATEDALRQSLFDERRYAEALIAWEGGQALGFALYFHNYSTFLGKPGLYLEDLFVRPEHRGRGLGRRLLSAVAAVAVERGCGRFEWAVLDWNAPAIAFYQRLGARPLTDWIMHRVSGDALRALAAERR